MKTRLLFLLLLFPYLINAQIASSHQSDKYSQFIVTFKNAERFSISNKKEFSASLNQLGLKSIKAIRSQGNLKKGTELKQSIPVALKFSQPISLSSLKELGLFDFIEPDYIYVVGATEYVPNDPSYGIQWGLRNNGTFQGSSTYDADVDMDQAWLLTTGSDTTVLAFIDSGCRLDHPEIADRIWVNPNAGNDDDGDGIVGDVNGWNFVDDNNDLTDVIGHGTSMVGVGAAKGDNGIGIAGVNWETKIMNLQVTKDINGGESSVSDMVAAMYYAVDHGADVINISIFGPGYSQTFQDAIDYAYAQNVVVVACMGNKDSGITQYPAGYNHVIAVGGTSPDNTRSVPFTGADLGSNYGNHITVCAPGDLILSLDDNDTTFYGKAGSGTSPATALVSGLVSLMRGVDKSLSVDSIRQLLILGAVDQIGRPNEDVAGWDQYHGHGLVNAYNTLRFLVKPDTILYANSCGESYDFGGNTQTVAGVYYDSLTNQLNGDSIVMLVLKFLPASSSSMTITADSSYDFNGVILSESGIYYDTLTSSIGCDSIITLSLTITADQGLSCEYPIALTEEGVFNVDLSFGSKWYRYIAQENGILTLRTCNLTSVDTKISLYQTDCSTKLTESDDDCGLQSQITRAMNQGDTLLILVDDEYTIGETIKDHDTELLFCSTTTYNVEISSMDYYVFDGDTLTNSGDYSATFTSQFGCDSIVDLQLLIAFSCSGLAITDLTTTGIYIGNNEFGDDLYRYTAEKTGELIVASYGFPGHDDYPSPTLQLIDTYLHFGVDCAGWVVNEASDDFKFSLQSSIKYSVTQGEEYYIRWKDNHNDSSFAFQVGYVQEGPSYECDQPKMVTAGEHLSSQTLGRQYFSFIMPADGTAFIDYDPEDLTMNLFKEGNCDSIIETAPYDYNWSIDSLVGGQTYVLELDNPINWTSFQLRFCETHAVSVTTCEPYEFDGQLLNASGNYSATFTMAGECDSIVNLNLTILDPSDEQCVVSALSSESIVSPVRVYPNPTDGALEIVVGENESMTTLTLLDMYSKELDHFLFMGNTQYMVEYPTGIYYLVIQTADQQAATVKVIKK